MFERFTEQARKGVVLAQEEALHFNHDYIGTEHLLLGLLREEEGIAARVLDSLDVTSSSVREKVENMVGYGEETGAGQVPFTPRSKKVLELSLREAMRLGHDYIGTEHLLLGLARERGGVAMQALSSLGVGPDKILSETLRVLEGGQAALARSVGRSPNMRPAKVRARVGGLVVQARCGITDEERAQFQPLSLDLDYTYGAGAGDDPTEAVEHGALLDSVDEVFEQEEFQLPEMAVRRVGERILDRFPQVWEVTVTATKTQAPVGSRAPEVSAEATFYQ